MSTILGSHSPINLNVELYDAKLSPMVSKGGFNL